MSKNSAKLARQAADRAASVARRNRERSEVDEREQEARIAAVLVRLEAAAWDLAAAERAGALAIGRRDRAVVDARALGVSWAAAAAAAHSTRQALMKRVGGP